MKNNRLVRGILLSVVIVALIFIFQDVKAATTAQYFNTGRNGSNLSASANVNKVIPSEYSFELGKNYDSVTVTGAQALSAAEVSKWRAKTGESNEDNVELSSLLDKTQYISKAVNGIKNSFSATYKNVGRYNNQSIDVKVTVVDFAVTSGDFYYNDYAPFISFLDSSYEKLGIYAMNLDWVKLKYDFYKSGTTTAVSVRGYTTYWDLDKYQGVHILDNNKGYYTATGVKLKVSKIDSADFIYESENKKYDGYYNPAVSFTELFEGSSITRVYTPARPVDGMIRNKINRARGTFYNSAVTAVPKKEYNSNTTGESRTVVKVGDTITYKITYTNVSQTDSKMVTITDKISKGLEYVNGSSTLGNPTKTTNADGSTTLVWNVELAKDTTAEMTYSAKVTNSADVLVNNGVTVKVGTDTYTPDPLKNPIPKKEYAADTPTGANGSAVKKDNIIKYSITYANPKKEAQKIIVTDIISKGLTYVDGSAMIGGVAVTPTKTSNADGSTTLVWTRNAVGAGLTEVLTYQTKVTGTTLQVKNKATVKYELDPIANLKELRNPVPKKAYAADTLYGKNGAKVKENNVIKYSIRYVNTYPTAKTIKITDTLSTGLEYVEGSAKWDNEPIQYKSKNRDDNFNTTLVFEKESVPTDTTDANVYHELTYEALVLGDVDEVKNKASLEYVGSSSITLDELKNPLDKPIWIDNVGSAIAISGIIFGVLLVGGGSYLIYKRYKKIN